MDTGKDPESRDQASLGEEIINGFLKDGDKAISDRHSWERKAEVWYSRRYGLRAAKNFPWPGSSNLNIPFTDKVMRRLRPVFQSAVFRVNPIVSIEPLGETRIETARALEEGYDWLVRYRMKRSREELSYSQDAMLMYGFSVVKAYWDYESDLSSRSIQVDFVPEGTKRSELSEQDVATQLAQRLGLDPAKKDEAEALREAVSQFNSGEETIAVEIEREVYNAPRWAYVDPMDIIVPWDSDTDIDNFPWMAHRMWLQPHQLEARKKSGRYDSGATTRALNSAKIVSDGQRQSTLEQRRQWREGASGDGVKKKENSHEVWELYFRHDANGDGVSERYVATIHRASSEVLRLIEFPYEHNEWPFTRYGFEQTEPRWYASRGIPELLYDLQVEINAQHNAKIDNMAITHSKSFIYREGSVRNPNQWRWKPGAMFPARRTEDVVPINHQVLDYSFNAEEENLRAWGEEYVGTPDFGISNINQRVERRTATEIEQIQSSTGAIADAALEVYQEGMRRLHRQTLFLWAQYGDPQVLVRVTGSDRQIVFVRYDIYKDFDLVPTGRLDNLNSQARISKAMAVMNLVNNPATSRYLNAFEVTRDVVENLDYRNSQRWLMAPGVFEQNEAIEQVNEINYMDALGEVHPVDFADDHAIHLEVLGRAIQAAADDQGKQLLLTGHAVLHAALAGDQSALQQFQQQTGAQVEQMGNRLVMVFPQQAPQGQPAEEGQVAQ